MFADAFKMKSRKNISILATLSIILIGNNILIYTKNESPKENTLMSFKDRKALFFVSIVVINRNKERTPSSDTLFIGS